MQGPKLVRQSFCQKPSASPIKDAEEIASWLETGGSPGFGEERWIVWLYGLSGAGKSTIAALLRDRWEFEDIDVAILDGDDLRGGLCADLGFSSEDRAENIRRAREVALILARSVGVVICSFITPFEADRRMIAQRCEERGVNLALIHLATPIELCEKRDVKGLYRRFREGRLTGMTGIDAPFEYPASASATQPRAK